MTDSPYGQIKENALETARAIRNGMAVGNVDAARIESAVQAIEELEREKAETHAGLIQIRDAVREIRDAGED